MLFVTVSRDKSNRRDGKLDETQFPSARFAGNATPPSPPPPSFDASAGFSLGDEDATRGSRERISFDCRGLN